MTVSNTWLLHVGFMGCNKMIASCTLYTKKGIFYFCNRFNRLIYVYVRWMSLCKTFMIPLLYVHVVVNAQIELGRIENNRYMFDSSDLIFHNYFHQ